MKPENDNAPGEASAARWRSLLRDHDPAQGSIDPQRAIQIRHAAIEMARSSSGGASPWRWRLVLGAVAIVLLAAGAGDDGRSTTDRAPVGAAPGSERRQVQFATPGGTRIIWEINPAFSVREMVP